MGNMAKKILIADDSAFMRLALRDILTKGGYDVAGEAETGEEAVKKSKHLQPDLITMDIVMVGGGGIEAVKNLIGNNPQVKILMVSAMGQQQMILEALESGAMDFLVKPFQPAKVLETVKKCLAADAR